MAVFSNIRQSLGNFVDYASTPLKKYGLPDFGISERIAGGNTINTGKRLAPQGNAQQPMSSYDYSQARSTGGVVSQPQQQPQPQQQQQSQGGGGGGGGLSGDALRAYMLQQDPGRNPADNSWLQQYLQPQPQQQTVDFDALIAPALQGLDAAVAPQESAYQANVGQIEGNVGRAVAGQQSALSEAQSAAEQARQRQGQIGEDAVNEQRRMFSEQQQGLQARYGGTTGTGRFAAEQAGSQTTRNVAQIRQSLSESMQNIDNTIEKVRTTTQMYISDAEDKANELKLQAKAQLDQALGNIRIAKSELVGKKAELASQAVQFYQQQLAQVNAANTTFKQNIFLQSQKAEQDLALAKQSGQAAAQKLTAETIGYTTDANGNSTPIRGTLNPRTGEAKPFAQPTIGGASVKDINAEEEELDLFGRRIQ